MARSILIADSPKSSLEMTGLGFNTVTFEVIVEGTRANFLPDENECLKQCFRDYDELYQEYILLGEIGTLCFNTFISACEAGLKQLKETGEVAINYVATQKQVTCPISEWEVLIEMLRQDSRYLGS